jgi:Transposase DDE domain
MVGTSQTTTIRRRLYSFAAQFASPFSDSRRRSFITDMVTGLIGAGHVQLTAIARSLGGAESLHAAEKRLSRHLGSEHWNMAPVADELLRRSAARVTDDTLLVADTTDLSKPYARKLEGLGRVHDGSDPAKGTTRGYGVFEAYVRVGRWQLFPLLIEPLKVYAGAPTGENAELLSHLLHIHAHTAGRGTWLLDRGFDRRELFGPLLRQRVAFVVRQTGERHVRLADGRVLAIHEVVAELRCPRPRCWPKGGTAVALEVWLPEVSAEPFLLAVGWRRPDSERPLIVLVSPAARRARRTAGWYIRAYHRRWGVEDATRGIKQQFALELFLVRTWSAIRRLLWLVACAFCWLNLWDDDNFQHLRDALLGHPWRLPKKVTYLFNWIATLLRQLLHPHPKLQQNTG